MTWNYRVVRDVHKVGDQEHEWFSIREVYYDDDGNISSWADRGHAPSGDTWAECFEDHGMMLRALAGDVVDVSGAKPVEVRPVSAR